MTVVELKIWHLEEIETKIITTFTLTELDCTVRFLDVTTPHPSPVIFPMNTRLDKEVPFTVNEQTPVECLEDSRTRTLLTGPVESTYNLIHNEANINNASWI